MWTWRFSQGTRVPAERGPRIIDISPLVSPRTAVFPGDNAFSREVLLSIAGGANIDLSTIRTTVHVGAHADAPSHYQGGGDTIEMRALWRFYGPCQVVSVPDARGRRIVPADVTVPITAPRVLFHTGSMPDPNAWNDDFAALSPELIAWLHDECGVHLVGIDTPSIDPPSSKGLESHGAVAARDMSIIEGLVLGDVAPSHYTLVAFPLKLEGADASPVRAVLLDG